MIVEICRIASQFLCIELGSRGNTDLDIEVDGNVQHSGIIRLLLKGTGDNQRCLNGVVHQGHSR